MYNLNLPKRYSKCYKISSPNKKQIPIWNKRENAPMNQSNTTTDLQIFTRSFQNISLQKMKTLNNVKTCYNLHCWI